MQTVAGVVALGWLLASCAYTYLPPIPEIRTAEPRLDIRGSPGLRAGPEGLRLDVRLNEVPQAGWLAVQWFDTANQEVASDSVWITPGSEGTVQTLGLSTDIPLTGGVWRALLSFEGQVLRQFTLDVSSAGPERPPQPTDDEDGDQP